MTTLSSGRERGSMAYEDFGSFNGRGQVLSRKNAAVKLAIKIECIAYL